MKIIDLKETFTTKNLLIKYIVNQKSIYLKKLNLYYENWISKHPKDKVLTIDLSENDFIEDPKFLKKIYSMIEKKINELT